MAVFDLQEQKIFVRIVYDGAANAGKTTNIRQLSELFTTRRRSELYSPEDLDGRTLFFDWLQIASGLVMGFPVVCQVLTVPGQDSLGPRRRHLLATADFVIFVVESTAEGIARAARVLPSLREARDRCAFPLLVQANKQDLEGVVAPGEIAGRLGLGDAPVLAASASESTGVLETFVTAMRAVTERIQTSALDGAGLDVISAESAEELYAELAQIELDADWRERIRSAPPPAPSSSMPSHAPRESEHAAATETPEPAAPEPKATTTADRQPDLICRLSEPPAPDSDWDVPAPSITVAAATTAPETSAAVPARECAGPPTTATHEAVEWVNIGDVNVPLPTHDVPTGFIWPASTGREILKTLDFATLTIRSDLVGQYGGTDGSGKSDTIICKVGDWCLKTSSRRHFHDVEGARAALVQAARGKTTLGELLMPQTVLALKPDADGSYWLWTITPWLRTLRASMVEASQRGDEPLLASALSTFAKAAVDAMILAARQGIVLDVHPSNYAEREGRVFYLDDDIAAGTSCPTLAYSLLHRVDEYGGWSGATEAYLAALEQQIAQRITLADLTRLDLPATVAQAIVRSDKGLDARTRLVRTLEAHGPGRG